MSSYEETLRNLDDVFKRDDVRGIWGAGLDTEIAWHLGHSFATKLREWKQDKKHDTAGSAALPLTIAVGRDMRLGSTMLAVHLMKGIEAAGARVANLGMCGTEYVYFAAAEFPEYQGGAMVTASHNPGEYAGVKFVKSGAQPLTTNELDQLKNETARSVVRDLRRGQLDSAPGELVKSFVEKLFRVAGVGASAEAPHVPLRVVVEVGNGMGGLAFRPVANRLQEALPGTEFVFSNELPDGHFPVCLPNPMSRAYTDLLGKRVQLEGADLGICFDGDADRAALVDGDGQGVDPGMVAIALFQMLMPAAADRRFVFGNLNTGLRFLHFVAGRPNGWQGEFVWTPVGHAKIKELMRTAPYSEGGQCKVLFAAEHSGHYFYPDFYCADSGTSTAVLMIRFARQLKANGKSLGRYFAPFGRYFASGEMNEPSATDQAAIEKIARVASVYARGDCIRRGVVTGPDGVQRIQQFDATQPYDPSSLVAPDLRVDSKPDAEPGWWFSVRKAGNEPLLRLNVESIEESCMKRMRDDILQVLRS